MIRQRHRHGRSIRRARRDANGSDRNRSGRARAAMGLEVDPIAEAHVHVVHRGACWLRTTVERRPIRLSSGDVVLIRGGIGHSICDDPKTKPAPYRAVLEAMPRRLASSPTSRAHETTVVFCAKYLFHHVGPHPLTSLLPPLIQLPAHEAERHVHLQLLLQLLRHEALDWQRYGARRPAARRQPARLGRSSVARRATRRRGGMVRRAASRGKTSSDLGPPSSGRPGDRDSRGASARSARSRRRKEDG